MSDETTSTNDEMRHFASEAIPLSIGVWILLLPILVIETFHRSPVHHKDSKRTRWLLIAVTASNAAHQLSFMFRYFSCSHCELLTTMWGDTRALLKCFNWLFVIHRAKLAQAMQPILSQRCFEVILPCIIITIAIGFLYSITTSNFEQKWICSSYEDWEDLQFCITAEGGQTKGIVAAAMGLDGFITISMMALFVVPLYRVSNSGLGVMNDHQRKQRRRLRKLLIWSIVLTFVNQATSILVLIHFLHSSKFTHILWQIGQFDPPLNVWTSWLMLNRNREYLRSICKRDKEIKEVMIAKLATLPSISFDSIESTKDLDVMDQISLEMKESNATTNADALEHS